MFSIRVNQSLEIALLEEHHAETLFTLVDRNRDYLRRWLSWLDQNTQVNDSLIFIRRSLQQFANYRGFQGGIFYWGELVGVVGIRDIDWSNRTTSISYWLGQDCQGKGIMTRACETVVDYVFQDLKLNRLEIRCHPDNFKSRAIPERLGFEEVGYIKKAIWHYDRFKDLVIYGLLACDYKYTPKVNVDERLIEAIR